jgi:hypothetical protein
MPSVYFNEEDAAAELVAMLSALEQSTVLSPYQESVVEGVINDLWEDLPEGYVESVDEEVAELLERLESR